MGYYGNIERITMNKQHYVKDNKFIIKFNDKEYVIPKPFTNCYFGADPTKMMTIFNRFSDETFQQSARIPAFAVAIYDTTIGAEASEDYDLMNKGREWFQKNFTDAYYTLLD